MSEDSAGPSLLSERYAWVLSEWRRVVSFAILLLTDWVALALCLCAAWAIRNTIARELFPALVPLNPLGGYFSDLYYFAPWIMAIAAARLYTQRSHFWEEARGLVRAATAGTVLAVLLTFAGKTSGEISRTLMGGVWLVTLPVLPLARYGVKVALSRLGFWRKKILIVGAGEPATRIRSGMSGDVVLGYEPVAFVRDGEPETGEMLEGLPVLGPFAALPRLIEKTGVRDVVIAIPDAGRQELASVVSVCEGHVENVRIMPDMLGLASVGVETDHVGGQLLLRMRWNLAKPWNTISKRLFDLLVSAVALFLLAPVFAALAAAIKLDSSGPVFFTQERVGRGGGRFRCYKFRSMFVDGDRRLRELFAADPEAREEWERFAKLKRPDPRVTEVGRLLRRLSLDELPQLANVFMGDMSLVGPRPYLPSELVGREAIFHTILKTSPGITGLWQVSGRNQLTMEQRQQLDEYYVRNWSLWTDIVILLQTVGVVLRGEGAY